MKKRRLNNVIVNKPLERAPIASGTPVKPKDPTEKEEVEEKKEEKMKIFSPHDFDDEGVSAVKYYNQKGRKSRITQALSGNS